MNHKRPPIPVIVLASLVLLVGGYFGLRALFAEDNSLLQASGTIEAVDVSVSPELAGKVARVLVQEGDSVQVGDALLILDDSLLTAQRAVAAAGLDSAKGAQQASLSALETAQTQYDLVLIAARLDDRDARLSDWAFSTSAFDQPNWYFTRSEQISAAQLEVQAAEKEVIEASDLLRETVADLQNAEFVQAEVRLANARIAYLVAEDVYNRSQIGGEGIISDQPLVNVPNFLKSYKLRRQLFRDSDNDELIDAAQADFDTAKGELDLAQQAFDDLVEASASDEVLIARAELSVAIERYNAAVDRLNALRTGEFSPRVAAAQSAVDQAEAAAQQAQHAVEQARANLDLIDVQLGKLEIQSPTSGTVLTRNVEPGEFVQPGAAVFTLANLEELTITVYVPEDRYGEISIGQGAKVTVDSFPGEAFEGNVVYIAESAEYTPRNVQTVEGRSATVYAVRIQVLEPGGKLKPGMPADVRFVE